MLRGFTDLSTGAFNIRAMVASLVNLEVINNLRKRESGGFLWFSDN